MRSRRRMCRTSLHLPPDVSTVACCAARRPRARRAYSCWKKQKEKPPPPVPRKPALKLDIELSRCRHRRWAPQTKHCFTARRIVFT